MSQPPENLGLGLVDSPHHQLPHHPHSPTQHQTGLRAVHPTLPPPEPCFGAAGCMFEEHLQKLPGPLQCLRNYSGVSKCSSLAHVVTQGPVNALGKGRQKDSLGFGKYALGCLGNVEIGIWG